MLLQVFFIVSCVFGTGAQSPCHLDWEQFEETCYGFGEAEVTWGDAQEMCRASGAKLTEIETQEENDFLGSQGRHRNGDVYWVGGTDVFHEGTWTWITTGELIYPFTNWEDPQPDDAAGHEDCMVIRKNSDYKWNDYPCDNKYLFICEMPVSETVVG